MYPTQEKIIKPLLHYLVNKGGWVWFSDYGTDIEDKLADHFKLTHEEREETRPDINIKGKRVWRLNIQWARKKAVEKGYMDGSVRDRWEITEAGLKYIDRKLE